MTSAGRSALAALFGPALVAGCLVFDGKVAETNTADASIAPPDSGINDGSMPSDGGHSFCAFQSGYLLCQDFDESDSAADVFSSIDAGGAGTVTIDSLSAAPPPSPPHALDILLPDVDGGSTALANWSPAFAVSTMTGLECSFDVLYDEDPASATLFKINLNDQNYRAGQPGISVDNSILLVQGFHPDGGGVYIKNPYAFVWTKGTWHSVDLVVDWAAGTAKVTFDGEPGSVTSVDVPGLGEVFGGSVTLGSSQSPGSATVRYHLDNVVCRGLDGGADP